MGPLLFLWRLLYAKIHFYVHIIWHFIPVTAIHHIHCISSLLVLHSFLLNGSIQVKRWEHKSGNDAWKTLHTKEQEIFSLNDNHYDTANLISFFFENHAHIHTRCHSGRIYWSGDKKRKAIRYTHHQNIIPLSLTQAVWHYFFRLFIHKYCYIVDRCFVSSVHFICFQIHSMDTWGLIVSKAENVSKRKNLGK